MTSLNSNVTDFGVLGQALQTVGTMAQRAIGSNELLYGNAFEVLKAQAAGNNFAAASAIDFARTSTGAAQGTAAGLLGLSATQAQTNSQAQTANTAKTSEITKMAMIGAGNALQIASKKEKGLNYQALIRISN